MSEGFVPVEDPKHAHVGKAHIAPVWWKCWRAESAVGVLTIVAVYARTWFAARACARVLLGTDEIDGGELVSNEIDAALARGPAFFIGLGDVVFFDLAPHLSHGSAHESFCTRRAEFVDGEFREVAADDVQEITEQNDAPSLSCLCDADAEVSS